MESWMLRSCAFISHLQILLYEGNTTMKKFKIEYGIVREYDEVTLWFEPIDDDLDALVLRNRSGEILSVFTEQRKKGREGSGQKG